MSLKKQFRNQLKQLIINDMQGKMILYRLILHGLLLALTVHVTTAPGQIESHLGSTPLTVTVLPVTLEPNNVPPGAAVKMKYTWQASQPTADPYTVFVHILDTADRIELQDDHVPSIDTSTPGWRGTLTYERRLVIPTTLMPGTYRIVLGLYNQKGRLHLNTRPGVTDAGNQRYEVGQLTIDPGAPWPKPDTDKAPSLDLSSYHLIFAEEFDASLDVSAWGPGTRWIAHTPWAGDFGDARFSDPQESFPFTIHDGILHIEARKNASGPWSSGLLASNDPLGQGFSLQYGYFEMRAKLPPGPGVWPAFWLCSSYNRRDPQAGRDGSVEIDVMEYYGHAPHSYTATVHIWHPEPHSSLGTTITTQRYQASTGFHRYGCRVDPQWMTFYFDGIEVWHTPTPPEHNKPLMMLLNLALGPGWPIDKTPNPSVMEVDYVRAYTLPEENH